MNQYQRRFRSLRKTRSAWPLVRRAAGWTALGFVLHWAVTWQPRQTAPALARRIVAQAAPARLAPASLELLKGRRIAVESRLPGTPGVPDMGPAAWLRAVLDGAGAKVAPLPEPYSRASLSAVSAEDDSAPSVVVRFETADARKDAPLPRFTFVRGDSSGARAALYLSASVSARLCVPLPPPTAGAAAGRVPPGAALVRVALDPRVATTEDCRRLAEAMARGLAIHFRSAPDSSL